jgi:cytoskeleton protein RodZ
VTFLQRIRSPFTDGANADGAQMQPRQRLVGDLLQERREDLGLDLDEIGAMLRIKPAYLAALEQGRTDDLPGPAYAIGFIRAYADFLGLDAEQVLARLKGEASGVTVRPDLALPVPLGERSLPGRGLVLVALILALCGYGIWYYLSTEDRNRPERVAAVPAALQVSAPTSVAASPPAGAAQDSNAASAGTSPMPSAAANPAGASAIAPLASVAPASPIAPTAPAGSSPAPVAPPTASVAALSLPVAAPSAPVAPPTAAPSAAPVSPSQAAGTSSPASTTRPAAPAQAVAQTASAAPTDVSKVSIKALTDCWIQIRSADQSIVFSRILKSGETYTVPARPGLSLRTGNAGALEIAVDGKPAPSIGAIGTLRRDVALDPVELAAGTAVHG